MITDILFPLSCLGFAILSLNASLKGSFLLALFLSPFKVLELDFGVSISASQIVLILTVLRVASGRKFVASGMPARLLLLSICVSIFGSLYTFLTAPDSMQAALRMGVSLISLFLACSTFFARLDWSERDIEKVAKVAVYSGYYICLVGLAQFIIFIISGVDIIPLGYTQDGSDRGISAFLDIGGTQVLRPGSLAGEPKSLGIFAAMSTIVLVATRSQHRKYPVILTVLLAAMFLTGSSSAFFVLAAGIAILIFYRIGLRSSWRAYVGSFAIVCFLIILYVWNLELIPYHLRFQMTGSLSDLLFQRTLGRFEVEDMDHVIVQAMLDDWPSLAFGKGVGLSHLGTSEYVPADFSYMRDYLIAPKSGAVYLLACLGALGGSFFVLGLGVVAANARARLSFTGMRLGSNVVGAMLFFLFIGFILRSYIMDFTLLVFGITHAAASCASAERYCGADLRCSPEGPLNEV